MDELDSLFSEGAKSYRDNSENNAEKIVREAQEDFQGISDDAKAISDRKVEVKKLNERLAIYKKKLRACKNVKNRRSTAINKERAEQRKNWRRRIADCEIRLSEIKEEIKGSQLNTDDFVEV